jgi:hypothetical protein
MSAGTEGRDFPRRVVVAAFCALSATTMYSSAGEPFEVGIHLRVDPSITSRRITERLKDEAEAIWRPYGVRLAWMDAGASEAASKGLSVEASLERELDRRRWMEWPAVLGRAVMTPDTPNRRPIRVSFDATESVLALRTTVPSTMKGIVRDHELATALGRVLAHEIGHVLLDAPYHDHAGLMRAAFGADGLAAPARTPFRLTCSGVDRLRSRSSALSGSVRLVEPRAPRRSPDSLAVARSFMREVQADVHDPTWTKRGFPGDRASCIAIQPAR